MEPAAGRGGVHEPAKIILNQLSIDDLVALMHGQVRSVSARRIVLACSGGRDSMVLAHLAAHHLPSSCPPMCLLHVHHGLDEQAQARAEHCVQFARRCSMAYQVAPVTVTDHGMGPEAAAREARYRAWRAFARDGDLFWTAHHLDDQAETVLLQLMRGGGVDGLAAMPALRRLCEGSWLGRPLLEVSGGWIGAYAERQAVSFMDDPANDEVAYSRNYVRRRLAPLLSRHWPAWTRAVARSARHQSEAAMLLRSMAERLLDDCAADDDTLSLIACRRLPRLEQKLLLRHWLKRRGLPVPQENQLNHALMTFLSQLPAEGACTSWHGAELRCYRGRLHAMPPQPALGVDPKTYEKAWPCGADLDLPELGVRLSWQALQEQAPAVARAASASDMQPIVRLRRGGERCAVAARSGRTFHRPLKKVFQQLGVPPWKRARLPLIYQNDELRLLWGWPLFQPKSE